MVYRVYAEKKSQYSAAEGLKNELVSLLGVKIDRLRKLIRYDVEGLEKADFERAVASVFSEPMVDEVYETPDFTGGKTLVTEYLDGQYDQRADSAAQCVQFLTGGVRPIVRCATVYVFYGVTTDDLAKIKKYLINPVDSREGDSTVPETLKRTAPEKTKMRVELSIIDLSDEELKKFYDGFGFAMTYADLQFVRDYFRSEKRNPTLTEIKVIDTYWSDHCRHTTFLTHLNKITIKSNNPRIRASLARYRKIFKGLYKGRRGKYACLMDVATIAAKELKREGYLDNLDESDEINACSVKVTVDVDGKPQDWLIMFKNETHNHPTEIEPFGGAATCLGGAIRDPLSGRTYVYQAMRVTGAADITEDFDKTLPGKLPQRVISKTALAGFSSYGNQIGLATGGVYEMFDEGYKSKRLETGYVIGGAPAENVRREQPRPGDVVLLVGGDTGRDGCGGATGSSKSHTASSVETCGAEVQKGNPPEERKLQRLFRNPEAAKLIIKCNDFGAGGVCVAIGELSPGLDIYLDRIIKKYDGLTATELAISESQERMAVVVKPSDADRFIELAASENLKAVKAAVVKSDERLTMYYGNETIVDIKRKFLDTNGVKQTADAVIVDESENFIDEITSEYSAEYFKNGDYANALKAELRRLDVCSQKGMGETFDGSIGAASVFMPFGGANRLTPSTVIAAKPPVDGFTHTVTASAYACYPRLMRHSPFIGAVHSVLSSVAKLVAAGVKRDTIRLSLQEYFKRLGSDPERWGEPLAALLGAMDAQLGLKTGAIGGKDSMSGTFENIDVPPTLISFATGVTTDDKIISDVFDCPGKLYLIDLRRDYHGYPYFDWTLKQLDSVSELIEKKKILRATVVEEGGYAVAIAKSIMGSGYGMWLTDCVDLFCPMYGDIIALAEDDIGDCGIYIGEVMPGGEVTIARSKTTTSELIEAYTSRLESVYPTSAKAEGEAKPVTFDAGVKYKAKTSVAAPRVFIPVFPGTNCEYDMARAFEREGAKADIFVMKNLTAADIEYSVAEMKKRIDAAQIIAFPGGFSGGDEPDGSGKFIVNTFLNPVLSEAVENLLYKRDGLILGICNGFQALVKLGLLPDGHVSARTANSPTLTFNNIARHVSDIVNVRVATNKSPWLRDFEPGETFAVPVSHGEGKFVCSPAEFEKLAANGQIATQYAMADGTVTMRSPFNPNGSFMAVEGIISPDGRVLGKMGHTERWQPGLYQNVPGNFDMNIFRSGVKYFK